MIAELEDTARRLEQQITSFEKLHTDELQRFAEQLAAYCKLQTDELQMLRAELQQFADEIARLKAAEAERAESAATPVVLTLTRRDLLTGHVPPFNPRQT